MGILSTATADSRISSGREWSPGEEKTAQVSFGELKRHFIKVAREALPLWGYPADAELKLLNITENATYKVDAPGLPTIVMRVHRLVYAERQSIMTELAWLTALRKETDLILAQPLPSLDGDLVRTIATAELNEKRHVVCFSYVPGEAPHDSHDDTGSIGGVASLLDKMPKSLTIPLFRFAASAYDRLSRILPSARKELPSGDAEMYRKLGEIAATLHTHASRWTPPDYYKRIEWDWNATFGPGWNNFYGAHYRDLTRYLAAADIRAISDCEALMHRRVLAYGTSPARYGMIHSDLRMGNLLKNGKDIAVLDFDDCGKGWYMYDIAGIVGFMEHRPDLQRVIGLIVEGYRKCAALPEEDEREIMTFVMMRRIGLLQAITYHLDNTAAGSNESAELTPEILAFYAKGTAALSRRYLKAYQNLPLPDAADTKQEETA